MQTKCFLLLLRHIKSILLLKGKLTFIIKNAQKSYVHHRQITAIIYLKAVVISGICWQ